MTPDHIFRLYSQKNDLHDFCPWGPPQVSWKKNFFFQRVKTSCACRVKDADYEYHNEIS